MKKVSIIGDGGWGTAIALLLYSKGLDVVLWSVSAEYADYLDKNRENIKFLKGVPLPDRLKITSDIDRASDVDYAFFVVPSEYLRSVAKSFSGLNGKPVISATKGIENGSLLRASEMLAEYFPESPITVLSGPSISFEVAMGMPTAVVISSKDNGRKEIQDLVSTENFRAYTSADIIGVELGGALKNVVAIAAGLADGMGFGINSKAAILTRGLAEITRLGLEMGADRSTFSGLSGLGDLATTCISSHSRNRGFGERIGKGEKIDQIIAGTEMVVEGMATCRSAYELSQKYNVDMPLTRKIYEVLYEGKDPKEAAKDLMTRDSKEE